MTRIYHITITFSVSQILDSDILAIFDKLYVLSRGGLCVYEGSVDHMSLFLRESDVSIDSKIQTPMERLMKVASKPNASTIKLANRVLSTREEILDLALKFGVFAPNGVETRAVPIRLEDIVDLFTRSFKHKYRLYWQTLLAHYLIMLVFSFVLTTAFNDQIGFPDSCYNKTSNSTIGRLIITENVDTFDNVNEQFVTLYGQNLVDENIKFLFVITICLSLFQMITSVYGLNEEIKVAINEHRNGDYNIDFK